MANYIENLPVTFVYDWDYLTIINPHKDHETYLKYQYRWMEPDENRPWIQNQRTETKSLFVPVNKKGTSPTIIKTKQGFIDECIKICKDLGLPYTVSDQRPRLPTLSVDKIKAFPDAWQVQKDLLIKAVNKKRSGCVKAPTRYGKTRLIAMLMDAYKGKKQIVLAAPGVDLMGQLIDDLKELLPGREIKGIYTGSKTKIQSDDITVCSFDSLHKIQKDNVDLLIIDEPHAGVSQGRFPELEQFYCMRLAVGATLEGRFDGSDKLIKGIFGPKLAVKTFQQGVAEGVLCPIKVFIVDLEFEHFRIKTRKGAYDHLLINNENMGSLLKRISSHIPDEWQTLAFIQTEKQAKMYMEQCPEFELAINKLFKKKKEREEFFKRMKDSDVKRCMATSIYSQGVTFPKIRVVINCAGGGGNISSTQRPGRLAQKMDGKIYGYVIDFRFKCVTPQSRLDRIPNNEKLWMCLSRDAENRIRTYREKGYELEYVNDYKDIQFEELRNANIQSKSLQRQNRMVPKR